MTRRIPSFRIHPRIPYVGSSYPCYRFFHSLLSPKVRSTLSSSLGISTPTQVQEKVIPLIASGKHLLYSWETGSGKTLSYLLPIIDKLEHTSLHPSWNKPPPFLVLTSSSVLQYQVLQVVKSITALQAHMYPYPEGVPKKLLGSPGIIGVANIDSIVSSKVSPTSLAKELKYLVLDEVDLILSSKSHSKWIYKLLDKIPSCIADDEVQVICTGATLPKPTGSSNPKNRNCADELIYRLSTRGDLQIVSQGFPLLPEHLKQQVIRLSEGTFEERLNAFISILSESCISIDERKGKGERWIVFFSSQANASHAYDLLSSYSFPANSTPLFIPYDNTKESLSFLQTSQQEPIPDSATHGPTVFLVTDALSRGLDLPNLSTCIHFDPAPNDLVFLHRSGRVAREWDENRRRKKEGRGKKDID